MCKESIRKMYSGLCTQATLPSHVEHPVSHVQEPRRHCSRGSCCRSHWGKHLRTRRRPWREVNLNTGRQQHRHAPTHYADPAEDTRWPATALGSDHAERRESKHKKLPTPSAFHLDPQVGTVTLTLCWKSEGPCFNTPL